MKSKVAIRHQKSVKKGIWEALDSLGEVEVLFREKYVAIKPNDTWASVEDMTACTQADTLSALIQYIKKFNPRKIVVSGGSGAAETSDVFYVLGLDKVIEREKVGFIDHNKAPFQKVLLEYGPQKEVMVNPAVLEYETLVSLAQHKVHHSSQATLTMKNIAMSFPAADYYGHPRWIQKNPHNFFKDLHGFIAGMCQRFFIDLGVIVGHPAMVQRGPVGGKVFESELAIASRDFVAADAVGAKLLGFDGVKHIAIAGELGLGQSRLEDIETAGASLEEAIKIFNKKRFLNKN